MNQIIKLESILIDINELIALDAQGQAFLRSGVKIQLEEEDRRILLNHFGTSPETTVAKQST